MSGRRKPDWTLDVLNEAGYTLQPDEFTIKRPDRQALALTTKSGRAAIAKLYPPGCAQPVYGQMCQLWESSFGVHRSPPGLPEPLECLADGSVLVMERLEGSPMAVTDPSGRGPLLENAMRLLAELHRCQAQANCCRTARRILRSVRRKAARLSLTAPDSSRSIWRVVEALEDYGCADSELVPCHGDFSPRNVLVAPGRTALIDWDRLQWADPARDVVYMGVWCWAWETRHGRSSNWSTLNRALALYRTARPGARLDRQVPFHLAAGLIRIAHSLAELWPEEIDLVPRLANEALEHLQ